MQMTLARIISTAINDRYLCVRNLKDKFTLTTPFKNRRPNFGVRKNTEAFPLHWAHSIPFTISPGQLLYEFMMFILDVLN